MQRAIERRNGLLVLVSLLALLPAWGCTTPVSDAEIEAATLYFPPSFKVLTEPSWSFTAAERQRALREYKQQGADTLFEFVIDSEGRVERSRLLRTHVEPVYHEQMEVHARAMVFSKDDRAGLYRAFYFPASYRMNNRFEWQ